MKGLVVAMGRLWDLVQAVGLASIAAGVWLWTGTAGGLIAAGVVIVVVGEGGKR